MIPAYMVRYLADQDRKNTESGQEGLLIKTGETGDKWRKP
jgi:hypothetical protein